MSDRSTVQTFVVVVAATFRTAIAAAIRFANDRTVLVVVVTVRSLDLDELTIDDPTSPTVTTVRARIVNSS